MHKIITEVKFIPYNEFNQKELNINCDGVITINVCDNGAGPYLSLSSSNLDESDQNFLMDFSELDEVIAVCNELKYQFKVD